MTSIPFCKFHGFGNDYIVIERDRMATIVPGELAAAICDRHLGAGADGIAILAKLKTSDVDYFCEIVNPDGSTAGFSGNGTRCAAAYLYYKELWTQPRLRLATRSGIKSFDLLERRGTGEFWFDASIGRPLFDSDEVPVATATPREAVVNEPIEVDDRTYVFSAVNVGNPVACIFVYDFDFDWRGVGKQMETHAKFPDRANIVFVKVVDRENIEIKIWERGVGETAASGTCSSAAAVLSAFTLKTDRKVTVHSEGGSTNVTWSKDGDLVIKGSAAHVYCGEWPLNEKKA